MQPLRDRYADLQRQLQTIGYVLPGSLQERRYRCGKPNCRCADGEPHGPYWSWTRKVRGKTVNVSLDEDTAGVAVEWIANNRRLRALVAQMQEITIELVLQGSEEKGDE